MKKTGQVQGELTENPYDKEPFRKKQQRALSNQTPRKKTSKQKLARVRRG